MTNGKICAYNYTSGETEEIFSVNENSDYYFRIEFLPTSKRFGLSTDGVNWNTYNMIMGIGLNHKYIKIKRHLKDVFLFIFIMLYFSFDK